MQYFAGKIESCTPGLQNSIQSVELPVQGILNFTIKSHLQINSEVAF